MQQYKVAQKKEGLQPSNIFSFFDIERNVLYYIKLFNEKREPQ